VFSVACSRSIDEPRTLLSSFVEVGLCRIGDLLAIFVLLALSVVLVESHLDFLPCEDSVFTPLDCEHKHI
jgi:hypothetical protein